MPAFLDHIFVDKYQKIMLTIIVLSISQSEPVYEHRNFPSLIIHPYDNFSTILRDIVAALKICLRLIFIKMASLEFAFYFNFLS